MNKKSGPGFSPIFQLNTNSITMFLKGFSTIMLEEGKFQKKIDNIVPLPSPRLKRQIRNKLISFIAIETTG